MRANCAAFSQTPAGLPAPHRYPFFFGSGTKRNSLANDLVARPLRAVRHAPTLTPVCPPVRLALPRLLAAETSKWKKISYAFIPFCGVYAVAVYVMHGAHHHEHEEVRL